ncbi:hypothetical protein ACLKA6_004555 [Drosophila palustris]
MTGHSWSMKEPLIIQRNTHLGDNQQQQQQHWRQQQQLWRSPHPTVSNCHYHGKSEALRRRRRHPSPHGQASMRQLNGFCCPLRASGSRRYHLQPAQQHQCRQQQQRSNWPFYTPSLWQQRQPQMQMGASVALLLLATTLLMLTWGISTPYLATLPPLPWPWQGQQQQHKHKRKHEEEEQQQRAVEGYFTRTETGVHGSTGRL